MHPSVRRVLRTLPAGAVAATIALAAFAGPASAAATLTVVGEASRTARPDMAVISTGTLTTAKTADEALAANSKAVTEVIAVLKAAGIEARDIATSNFSIQPQFSYPQPPAREVPKLIGYEVRNGVRVTVRDLAKLGPLLDKVIQAGANQSSGLDFRLSSADELEQEARVASVKDAMAQAKTMAEAAGMKLIRITSIQPADQGLRPMPMAAPMMMKADSARASVPVEAGEIEVRARTVVVYEAEPQ